MKVIDIVDRQHGAGVTCAVADSFRKRAAGWLAFTSSHIQEGLLLTPCQSVHTLFMRESIDVCFVNKFGVVLKIYHSLPPWRVAYCVGACETVELRSGMIASLGWRVSDQLSFQQLRAA